MEKKEFQKLFKEYVKKMGFSVQGNCFYKIIDTDYAITLYLDHHPYDESYFIEYGAIYEFDSTIKVSYQICWDYRFCFTTDFNDDLNHYNIEDIDKNFTRDKIVDWFDYVNRSKENFEEQMSINVQKRLSSLYDKQYVLDLYKNNWILFRGISYEKIRKICSIAGLDYEKVIEIRNSFVKEWPPRRGTGGG